MVKTYNLYRNLIESALEEGSISEEDLEDPEWLIGAIERDLLEPNQSMVIDHRESLLDQAKKFAKDNKYEYALVFFAMHFEHCVNAILVRKMGRSGFSRRSQLDLLRSATIHAKLTWILELLGLPTFNDRNMKAALDIAAKRNAFIHYKFTSIPISKDRDVEQESNDLNNAMRVASYVKRYEARVLYDRRKGEIKKKVRAIT